MFTTNTPTKPLRRPVTVSLQDNGDGTVDINAVDGDGSEWSIAKLNQDGTMTLWSGIDSPDIATAKGGYIKTVKD